MERPAEAPPGHVSVAALAHHALWDSWVHERDILLPQGIEPPVEADEVRAALRYAAALGPAFAVAHHGARSGTVGLRSADPVVQLTVEVGDRVVVRDGAPDVADLQLDGDAVGLLETLSVRAPFAQQVPDRGRWLLEGLLEAFDVAPG